MTEPITLSFTVEQAIPAGSTLVLTVMPPEVIEPPVEPDAPVLVFTPTDVTQAWSGNGSPVVFPTVQLGPESLDRIVVVALTVTANDDLPTVKVGDVALQRVVGEYAGPWAVVPQVWCGHIPTGTAANIELSGPYMMEVVIAVGSLTGSNDANLSATFTAPYVPSDDPHYIHAFVASDEVAVIATTVDRNLPTEPVWVNATGDAFLNSDIGNHLTFLLAHGSESNPGWSGGPGYGATTAMAIFKHGPVSEEERPEPPPLPEPPPIELPPGGEGPPPVDLGEVEPPSGPDKPIRVVEVTIVDHDEVCLEVRDDPITHGEIISNNGVSLVLSVPGACPIVGVSESPIDGSVRIVCSGNPFAAWYYDTDAGNAGITGVAGVQGLDVNGSWDIRRIDINTADLMATHFAEGWVSGTGKVWDYSNWTTWKGKRGWLAGTNQDYFRPCDLESTCFLNRSAAKWPDNWEVTGRTVTAVYIKSKNYDHGYVDSRTMGKYGETAALKHFIHLKLDGDLEQGVPYLIANDEAGILTEVTLDDRTTRAQAIHVTGVGHRPDDASKIGYLSLWRPGAPDEGAVDYGHLSEFEIIDSNGVTVGGPFPITLRIAANEAEERLGLGADNILGGYPDAEGMIAYNSTDPEKVFDLAAVSIGNPAEFQTDSDHGFAVGTKLRLIDMGGDGRGPSALTHLTVKVATVPTPDTFTAMQYTGEWNGEVSTVGMPPYADWLACGRTGKVARLNQSNRAGTNVYGLDYSQFMPSKPGTYRLRIAGLGVSDPVFIAPSAWGDVARAMAMGEYHHRWGIPLDGRFGVTRPANYVDGVTKAGNQGKIYQSVVPYPFGWGAPLYGIWPPLNDAACARPEAFLPDGQGGWHQSGYGHGGGSWADAGDWVTRLEQIAGACYCFCELALLRPQRAAATGFNVPKASEMFGDVPEYAGTDDMPDMVHQAIFGLEGYRRMQHGPDSYLPEGSVPGGLIMDTGTATTTTPSHLTPSVSCANAPDQMSSFAFAFAAAKIAQLCYANAHPDAGQMWEDSAIKAWDWAEKLYTSPEERDAYYGSVLGIPELASQQQFVLGTPWTSTAAVATGIYRVDPQATPRSVPKPGPWSTNTYLDNCEALNRAAASMRTNAGASLFRLTGEDDYRAAVEKGIGYTNGNANNIWFDPFAGITLAAWEYAETPGVNEQARSVIRNQFTNCHTRIEAGVEHYSGPIKAPCRTMMVADGGLWNMGGQGIDVGGVHWALIANHLISGDPRALKILQDGMSFIYGANPLSMSFVAQVGHRWPGTIFHADSLYAGRECDAGIGCYGYHFLGSWAFAFGTWKCSANAGCIESPDPRYAADHIFEREIDPGRYATPIMEAIWESHYQLNHMERSIQQDVFPLQNIAFYLDAWDQP